MNRWTRLAVFASLLFLFVSFSSAANVQADPELSISVFNTETVQERRNVTNYTTENVTLENGTVIENTTVSGWHWEPGRNTYLFEVDGIWTTSTTETKTDVTVELAPNNLTNLLVANKEPWKDIADGKHDTYDNRVDYFNQHYFFNGSNITQVQMDDLVAELDSIPVALDGEEQKTMTVKEKPKNVTVKVRSNTSQQIKIGSHSTVIATSGGSDDSYNKYKPVNVTSVSGTPSLAKAQLVNLTCGDDTTIGQGQIVVDCDNINGVDDVDFTNTTNHRLRYEFESFNLDNGGEAQAWVFKDSWVRDGTPQMRVHYGNGSIDEQDVVGTWDNTGQNAVMVQHLQNDPLNATDSTSNDNDGTVNGATATTGQFDGAASFDGDDNIQFDGSASSLKPDNLAYIGYGRLDTLPSDASVTDMDMYCKESKGPWNKIGAYSDDRIRVTFSDGSNTVDVDGTTTLATGTFYQFATTYDGSTVRAYLDASEEGTDTTLSGALDYSNEDARIGERCPDAGGQNWDGAIDAFRAYSEAKGDDWLKADYDASPTGGLTFFSQQAAETTDTNTAPSITIHHPSNTTYSSSTIDLNVTADEAVDVWQYSLDSAANQTFTPNTTISDLAEGQHQLTVYANDTSGNTNSTEVSFNVAANPTVNTTVATPDPVDAGQTVNITVNLSDTQGIDTGYINLTDPNSNQLVTNGLLTKVPAMVRFDDFENDTDGSTPDGWEGSTSLFEADTAVALRGSVSGRFGPMTATGTARQVERTLGDVYTRDISFAIRLNDTVKPDDSSDHIYIRFYESATGLETSRIVFHNDGTVRRGGTGGDVLFRYSPDATYQFNLSTDYTTDEYTLTVNGVDNGTYSMGDASSGDLSGVDSVDLEYLNFGGDLNVLTWIDNLQVEQASLANTYWYDHAIDTDPDLAGTWTTDIWVNDTEGNTATGTGTFDVTNPNTGGPTFDNASVDWSNAGDDSGSSTSNEVAVRYSDPDENVQNVTTAPSGSQTTTNQSVTAANVTFPFDWWFQATDRFEISTAKIGINLTTTDTGFRADDYPHTLTQQQWNRTVAVYNRGHAVNATISVADNGTVADNGMFDGDIASGVNQTVTEVWQGDLLADTQFPARPNSDEVTVGGGNFLGTLPLQVRNPRGFAWTGVDTTGISLPNGCTQSNNSQVDVAASVTANYSIGLNCDPGSITNADLDIITLADNNTKYWYNFTLTITSNVSEETRIALKIDEDSLTDWDKRNTNTEGVVVGGSSTNTTVVDGTGYVYPTIGGNHGNSSLHKGTYQAGVTYTVPDDQVTFVESGGGGGGGSGGDTGGDKTIGVRFQLLDSPTAGFNQTKTLSLRVENYIDTQNTVTVEADPARSNGCQYIKLRETVVATEDDSGQITVQEGDRFASTATLQLPRASTGLTENSAAVSGEFIQVTMPDEETYNTVKNENNSIVCRFTATATDGEAEELVVEIRQDFDWLAVIQAIIDGAVERLTGGQFRAASLSASTEVCVDPAANLNDTTGDDTAECPADAQRSVPIAAVVLVLVAVAVVAGIGWRRR